MRPPCTVVPLIVFILCFSVCATTTANAAKVVNYKLSEGNAAPINECVNSAITRFRRMTCLQFVQQPAHNVASSPSAAPMDAISVVDYGTCSWRDKTVNLGRSCINEDNCARFLAQAISNERVYGDPVRHLNQRFNCTDKCTIDCQNGGQMLPNCSCKCGYGFSGTNCEQLALRTEFTDPSCGIISGEEEGTISLSSYPRASAPKGTFCQWLVKTSEPSESVEFEFVDLDLNYENAHPGSKCADSLLVLGVSGIENPVPCEPRSMVGRRFRADGDWTLFTLSTNTWSRAQHKGPLIKYRVIRSSKEIRSFSNAYMNSAPSKAFGTFAHLLLVFVIVCLNKNWL